MKYFPQIDALRAISVFIVIFHHLPIMDGDNLFTQFFRHFSGVDIFFVISGFLITRILLINKVNGKTLGVNLKTFYIRRVFRIFPIYYAAIAYLFILNPGDYRDYFLNDLFYISNFKMGLDGEFASITPHFWSLAVEEQFYLFWPLLIFLIPLTKNRLIKAIVLVFCIGLGGKYFFDYFGERFLAARTINCLAYLSTGGILAYCQIYKEHVYQSLLKLWFPVVAVVLLLPIIEFYGNWIPDSEIYFPIHVLITTVIVAKFVEGFKGSFGQAFQWQPIIYLGKISYGLYVYHFLAIHFITPFNKLADKIGFQIPLEGYEGAVYKILVTIVIASLSWYFFEKPINKIKNRFSY